MKTKTAFKHQNDCLLISGEDCLIASERPHHLHGKQTGKLLKLMWLKLWTSFPATKAAFARGVQPLVLWWEAHGAHRACASCRENTFLLTAWLKLDHQMASLHLSRHLIKIWCLWSILSRIKALMWSGINIWFPLLSCVHLNIFYSIKTSKADTDMYRAKVMQASKALREWK